MHGQLSIYCAYHGTDKTSVLLKQEFKHKKPCCQTLKQWQGIATISSASKLKTTEPKSNTRTVILPVQRKPADQIWYCQTPNEQINLTNTFKAFYTGKIEGHGVAGCNTRIYIYYTLNYVKTTDDFSTFRRMTSTQSNIPFNRTSAPGRGFAKDGLSLL